MNHSLQFKKKNKLLLQGFNSSELIYIIYQYHLVGIVFRQIKHK